MRKLLLIVPLLLAIGGCSPKEQAPPATGRLAVIATIFPVYEFVREVGGDRVSVAMLLPPGVDVHSYEPKPADMARIAQARLFIFTSPAMEPWAEKLLAGAGRGVRAVDASRGLALLPAEPKHTSHDDHGHGAVDPHLWLDFALAQQMVTTIAGELAAADPPGAALYQANAASYRQKLQVLDARYRAGLAVCASRTLVQGGHAAFGYLAARYGLTARSIMGVAANAEPTPRQAATLVEDLKRLPVRTVFSEELISPRLAETLAAEAGARVVRLHAGHTLGKDELQSGTTFLVLMERNLSALRTGLACQ